jgi:uncharacterized protein (DUF433 family)
MGDDQGGSMDWEGCDLVEKVPGKVSAQPIIKGTRILADTIIEDAELGSSVEEIHENYPSVPVEKINKLIAFANSRQKQPQP